MALQFLRAGRIDLPGEQAEDDEAGTVVSRIAGTASGEAAFLAPTVFCGTKRVVAGEAGKLGKLRPDFFFVVALVFRTPNQAVHGFAELDGLPGTPVADPDPSGVFGGLVRRGLPGLIPVARHDRGEGIELEEKIGVAGRNHFVVDEFLAGTEVALEALFGARDDAARVGHVQFDGLRVLFGGIFRSVLAEPALGRAVAVLAADAFGDVERAAALLGRGVESVANQAFLRFFRFGAELQDTGHALANVSGEGLVGSAVLVLQNPSGIFVLKDAAAGDRFDAAMTAGGGAGARADISSRFILRAGGKQRGQTQNAQGESQGAGIEGVSHEKCRGSLFAYIGTHPGKSTAARRMWQCGFQKGNGAIYTRAEHQ